MIGIIAACVPCLKHLSERFLKRVGFQITTVGQITQHSHQKTNSFQMKVQEMPVSLKTTRHRPLISADKMMEEGNNYSYVATVSSPRTKTHTDRNHVIMKDETVSLESQRVDR